ncbi:MAG: UDP-N-acetylmuramate dehydrogenase [Deltaproteobacteria bacterium]|nr:UDP-N-acetylmuramate dehydrogenase [Deltaproteobacteria bacterium]
MNEPSGRTPRSLRPGVPFADLTTLAVGGPATYLAACSSTEELVETLTWAQGKSLPLFILGGGSNLLVADEGFQGVAIELLDQSLHFEAAGSAWRVRAGAGLPWDRLVAATVERGLTGIEALSGIPGRVGAAPIQNIGAYGQELATHLENVQVIDTRTGSQRSWTAAECQFGYRTSIFKGAEHRHLWVTGITLLLSAGNPTLAYGELQRRFSANDLTPSAEPTPENVRHQVLDIRRSKSMLLGGDDPNRRSAGSFFVNPVIQPDEAQLTQQKVENLRGPSAAKTMPQYPQPDGRIKLSAAWLIEAAGFHKGYCLGAAGLSTRHCLALVNRGGATAEELVALAARIRQRVRHAFGVTLVPEPVFLGFASTVDELLG